MADERRREERLLALVGLRHEDVARFRRVRLIEEGVVEVETRLGGGNAECWCDDGGPHDCFREAIESLEQRPNLREYEDDWGDPTYRYFRFTVLPHVVEEANGER